ncbi:hypothetical protein BDC45DRAFT_526978 [Circinella umbellata]|nr:hypothetical protein BDC45DRAFT_526978 [Circinella umbellata]
MIAETGNNPFFCKSFTNDDTEYTVSCFNNHLFCGPDYGVLCKHIFLVSRIKMIPFSVRRTYSNSNSTAATFITINIITEDDSQQQEFFTKTRAQDKNNNASLDDMINNMTRL